MPGSHTPPASVTIMYAWLIWAKDPGRFSSGLGALPLDERTAMTVPGERKAGRSTTIERTRCPNEEECTISM
ncbi:hypothetical protein BJX96DRAFT_143796, partial [Aspergillus floccosus]